MKNKGFTLVELLAIIVILGVVAAIITPVVQKSLKANKEKVYEILVDQIKDYTKDYLTKNTNQLPDNDGEVSTIKFIDLKKEGLLQINVVNPINDNIISNESVVKVTRKNNNYTYEVVTYDLVDVDEVEEGAPTISLSSYTQECSTACELEIIEDASRQIIYNGEEVSSIDLNDKGIYTVYYSKLENDKLGISIKTVTVK